MPNPTVSDLHVSQALTDLSIAHANEPSNFVAGSVFPVVPVMKQGNKFFEFPKDDWFRVDARVRAPGAESAVGGWRVSTQAYHCDRDSLAHDISDPERENADPAVSNLDGDATEYLTEQIDLKNELDFVAAFFTTGVWDGASSSTDMTGQAAPASTATNFLHWSDVASTPIEDLRGEIMSIAESQGRKPNQLTLGPRVWQFLADHPDVIDRIKYTERGIVTEDLLASLLGLDRVSVMMGTRNTAAEGSSAPSMAFFAGRSALLSYRPASPGLRTPSAGYTFVWTGRAGAPRDGIGARIKRYRLERNESDRIEAERWKDQKVTGTGYGAFFATAVST